MKPIERAILRGIVADREAARVRMRGVGTWRQAGHDRPIADGEIPLNPSGWLGKARVTPAEAQACSRAYKALEAAGLVERIAGNGGRVVALELTPAGEACIPPIRDAVQWPPVRRPPR